MSNVNLIKHPIVEELITKLRDIETDTELYRIYTNRVTEYLLYEALNDLEVHKRTVKTQTGSEFTGIRIGEKLAFITILRAGLGMFIPALENFPDAEFHAVGMKRNEEDPFNSPPDFYLDRLHEMSQDVSRVIIVDPMFATGGSMLALVDALRKKHRFKDRIDVVCLIVAKPGAEMLEKSYPEIKITCAGFDQELNNKGFIVPGLGDAGDRYFGINTDLSTVR